MVAGLSSRFGGKIKQFARVGPSGETLIEYSMNQAINAGIDKIVFVVGDKTEKPFKEMFGDEYKEKKVFYAKQEFDSNERDKPWGTVDALVSAKSVVNGPFIVCNGDDIYGKESFKKMVDFLRSTESVNLTATIGYYLGRVIPENGKTNRGIFKIENGLVKNIEEVFDIEKNNLLEKGLEENSLCSMNVFALQKETLIYLSEILDEFKAIHKGDRKIECLLPVELSNLIECEKIIMHIFSTDDNWFGVTNPEDEEKVRLALEKNNKSNNG
jgi:choline kinase